MPDYKSAFIDPELIDKLSTSANSINIARWLSKCFITSSLLKIDLIQVKN